MEIEVNKSSIMLILFLHASFIKLQYISSYNIIRYGILLILAIYLFLHYRLFTNNKFRKLNFLILIYTLCILVVSFINRNLPIERKPFLVSIVESLTLLEGYFLFQLFYLENRTKQLINIIFYTFLFYIVLNDIILIFIPNMFLQYNNLYLIGNKFSVSFIHLITLILFLSKNKEPLILSEINKYTIMFYLLLIVGVVISIIVECSTGIIGFVIFILIYLTNLYQKKIFNNFYFFITVLLISTFILLVFSNIVELPFVRYIIENVLHEDITLTGRLNIYQNLNIILENHLFIGYGMGSSYEISMMLISAPNVQNGILNLIVEQGIISLFIYILIFYYIFKNINIDKYSYILIYIFIMFILSSVEITITPLLLLWLYLVFLENSIKND